MRRVGFVLGVLIIMVGALVPALAQQPFADVPLDHWAYAAVNTLAEQGLIEGYPDGTFKGKQALTRYEFAQALARLMDRVEAMAKVPGPRGERGERGPAGPAGAGVGAGLTDEQKATLDRLAREFAPELRALRSDLDNLTKRVEDLESVAPPKGPVISASGDINIRAGLSGTELGVEDVEATGYPFFGEPDIVEVDGSSWILAVPYGGINLPFYDAGAEMWSDDSSIVEALGFGLYDGTIPISDALKDAYKAGDFLTQRTRVILSGKLAEDTKVKTVILADPRGNDALAGLMSGVVGSPNLFAGNGVMDTTKVDEAWVSHKTSLLLPVNLTAGKQYVRRGVGLLADNEQEATKGFRLDWSASDSLSWGAYLGLLDREQFYGSTAGVVGLPSLARSLTMYGVLASAQDMYDTIDMSGIPAGTITEGQDNYNLFYLDWKLSDVWGIGANWLDSGFNKEQGWSASLTGELYGLDIYGEYAKLTNWPTGEDYVDSNGNGVRDADELELGESDAAWMAGFKWSDSWLELTGEYGQVDAGYAFAVPGGGWSPVPIYDYFNLPLSALHPLAEVNPHYINWADRPLFLDPTNVARGWHVNVTFPNLLGDKTPLSVSYVTGDAYSPRYLSWLGYGGVGSDIPEPDKWVDADPVWTVQLTRQLNSNVTAKLLYGRREVDNVMSNQMWPVTVVTEPDQASVAYFAENDPIQVIRAELCVGF